MSDESCRKYITDEEVDRKIKEELETIRSEVNDLYTTVYKGNGTPSLVTRMQSVEGRITGLKSRMEERLDHINKENNLRFESIHDKLENKFGRLEGCIETRFEDLVKDLAQVSKTMQSLTERVYEDKNVDRAGRWQVRAAIITAAVSLIAGLMMYFNKP